MPKTKKVSLHFQPYFLSLSPVRWHCRPLAPNRSLCDVFFVLQLTRLPLQNYTNISIFRYIVKVNLNLIFFNIIISFSKSNVYINSDNNKDNYSILNVNYSCLFEKYCLHLYRCLILKYRIYENKSLFITNLL